MLFARFWWKMERIQRKWTRFEGRLFSIFIFTRKSAIKGIFLRLRNQEVLLYVNVRRFTNSLLMLKSRWARWFWKFCHVCKKNQKLEAEKLKSQFSSLIRWQLEASRVSKSWHQSKIEVRAAAFKIGKSFEKWRYLQAHDTFWNSVRAHFTGKISLSNKIIDHYKRIETLEMTNYQGTN